MALAGNHQMTLGAPLLQCYCTSASLWVIAESSGALTTPATTLQQQRTQDEVHTCISACLTVHRVRQVTDSVKAQVTSPSQKRDAMSRVMHVLLFDLHSQSTLLKDEHPPEFASSSSSTSHLREMITSFRIHQGTVLGERSSLDLFYL